MSQVYTSVLELEEALARPTEALVADMAIGAGDLMILGAGGKMGPTLCLLARRAMNQAGRSEDRVYAVSRWSDRDVAQQLDSAGVDVLSHDLLKDSELEKLPDVPNIVFIVGAKFGASDQPGKAWVVNVALPDRVARRFPASKIVALSTGNVYGFTEPGTGGATEDSVPNPVGEYAMSCLGRERIFQDHASNAGTPVALLRLNYAIDLRYGVLADIAAPIQRREPVDISAGAVNVVWQGYANEVILRSLNHASSKGFTLNLTGPETASIEFLARRMAGLLDLPVEFSGTTPSTALLSNATKCHALFGYPQVSLEQMLTMQAHWLLSELPLLDKPTKFTVRDGQF